MIDKLLVSVFSWLLAAVLGMQLLLTGLPLFRRLEYDAICHKYVMLMDQAGGLKEQDRAALLSELAARGFSVDQISGTRFATFGSELSLYVAARCPASRVSRTLLDIEEVELSFVYQSGILCRRLKGYVAVP